MVLFSIVYLKWGRVLTSGISTWRICFCKTGALSLKSVTLIASSTELCREGFPPSVAANISTWRSAVSLSRDWANDSTPVWLSREKRPEKGPTSLLVRWPDSRTRTRARSAAVALTQIFAYRTHKNLAVRKIMEVMRTAYTKSGNRSQHVSNYTWGNGRHASLVKGKRESFANNISVFRWIVWWY